MRAISRIEVDGVALTDTRIEAGLTLDVVAGEIGCNKSSLSRWEQGTSAPGESFIGRLAAYYGTAKFLTWKAEK